MEIYLTQTRDGGRTGRIIFADTLEEAERTVRAGFVVIGRLWGIGSGRFHQLH